MHICFARPAHFAYTALAALCVMGATASTQARAAPKAKEKPVARAKPPHEEKSSSFPAPASKVTKPNTREADDSAGSEPLLPSWSYTGKRGSQAWGLLADEYRTCAGGADQSPLDLREAAPGEGDALRFDYFPTPLSIVNDGHLLRLAYEPGSVISNGRGQYELVRIDIHTPSEHKIAGKSFPAEIQFVHRDKDATEDARLAIVSVMVKAGQRNPVLAAIAANAPLREGTASNTGLLFNANALLPRAGGYFYYPGSLTTPPCTEGVSWHVLKGAIEASKEQIDALRKPFRKGNTRPVQPLRDRVVREM